MTITTRRLLRYVTTAAIAIAFAGCESPVSTPLGPGVPDSGLLDNGLRVVNGILPIFNTVADQTIGPEGGTLLIAGGHTLHFPAGALADSTRITAVRDPLKIMVRFGPEGIVFPDSARPTLSYRYPTLGFLGIVNPSRLTIVYLLGGKVGEVLPTEVDVTAGRVRAELSHFSTYALATD